MSNFKTVVMRKTRFTESQIVNALKEYEAGKKAEDICRELGINRNTFYNWKKKYGGMETQDLKRLKELEEENRRLKKMYAEERLKAEIVAEALQKKW